MKHIKEFEQLFDNYDTSHTIKSREMLLNFKDEVKKKLDEIHKNISTFEDSFDIADESNNDKFTSITKAYISLSNNLDNSVQASKYFSRKPFNY